MQNFSDFGLAPFLLNTLEQMGITKPTPIQIEAIPEILKRNDILASAQTGTGKTIAYLLPLIAQLDAAEGNESLLILTPTRELAAQVKDTVLQLIKRIRKLNIALLIGGEPIFKQFSALKRRPNIIVGTPGRVIDHLLRRTLSLQNVRYLVLDETDRMLDMGFSQAIEEIVSYIPKERQTLMLSATIPAEIEKLSRRYLNNPTRITIGSSTQPSQQIKQECLQVTSGNKYTTLVQELENREGSVIIFVKTKIGCDRLADKLRDERFSADAIHGDLNQRVRDRVIRAFRNDQCRILVATDIAARGLDIPHIMHVINYDLPQCPEDYIHRIGRTGRAGMTGFALSFVAPDERHKWKAIHRLISPDEYKNKPRNSERGSDRNSDRNADRNSGKKKFGNAPRRNSGKPGGFKHPQGKRKPHSDRAQASTH